MSFAPDTIFVVDEALGIKWLTLRHKVWPSADNSNIGSDDTAEVKQNGTENVKNSLRKSIFDTTDMKIILR